MSVAGIRDEAFGPCRQKESEFILAVVELVRRWLFKHKVTYSARGTAEIGFRTPKDPHLYINRDSLVYLLEDQLQHTGWNCVDFTAFVMVILDALGLVRGAIDIWNHGTMGIWGEKVVKFEDHPDLTGGAHPSISDFSPDDEVMSFHVFPIIPHTTFQRYGTSLDLCFSPVHLGADQSVSELVLGVGRKVHCWIPALLQKVMNVDYEHRENVTTGFTVALHHIYQLSVREPDREQTALRKGQFNVRLKNGGHPGVGSPSFRTYEIPFEFLVELRGHVIRSYVEDGLRFAELRDGTILGELGFQSSFELLPSK